jgi:hypothetical protein
MPGHMDEPGSLPLLFDGEAEGWMHPPTLFLSLTHTQYLSLSLSLIHPLSHTHALLPPLAGPHRPDTLEDTGIVLSMGSFRYGYFAGGDCKSVMRADLQNTAGFVRDAGAVMTNFLLPVKVRVCVCEGRGGGSGRKWEEGTD